MLNAGYHLSSLEGGIKAGSVLHHKIGGRIRGEYSTVPVWWKITKTPSFRKQTRAKILSISFLEAESVDTINGGLSRDLIF